jgi:hypothetical protein
MAKPKMKVKMKRQVRRAHRAPLSPYLVRPSVAEIERSLKTRIVALLMLILASSLGLWFAMFQPIAIALWLLISLAGAYAVFTFDVFVSKAFVLTAALVMEFLILEGVPDVLVLASAGNIMLLTFGALDVILIYALMKL